MTLVANAEGERLAFNVARASHVSTLIFSNHELSDSILLVVDDNLEESGQLHWPTSPQIQPLEKYQFILLLVA